MLSRIREIAVLSSFVLLAVSGCSASDQRPVPKEGCAARECDGGEPKEIRCDINAESITDPVFVRTDNLEGVLEIRKAIKPGCDRLFWTRFAPAKINNGAWQLRQERNGEATKIQQSEDARPSLEGWTVVQYADSDDTLVGCVIDMKSQQQACTPSVTPR